jgi:hypothetical protein
MTKAQKNQECQTINDHDRDLGTIKTIRTDCFDRHDQKSTIKTMIKTSHSTQLENFLIYLNLI